MRIKEVDTQISSLCLLRFHVCASSRLLLHNAPLSLHSIYIPFHKRHSHFFTHHHTYTGTHTTTTSTISSSCNPPPQAKAKAHPSIPPLQRPSHHYHHQHHHVQGNHQQTSFLHLSRLSLCLQPFPLLHCAHEKIPIHLETPHFHHLARDLSMGGRRE